MKALFLVFGYTSTMLINHIENIILEKVVGGGQSIGTLDNGKKVFVWGGLPDEQVVVEITKTKSRMAEGIVTDVVKPSKLRIQPRDPDSYLSTSPWQIMDFKTEQHYKAALIEEAFELHDIVLPETIDIYSDKVEFNYRNKVEFSWYGDATDSGETLDLAFFRRGSKGKIVVDGTSLARDEINILARQIRDLLRNKKVTARSLKTLLIRSDQSGSCVWQLYVKDRLKNLINEKEAGKLSAQGGEVIYSDPRSPASRITDRLASYGDVVLTDTVHDTPFRYATEGFFQINLPVYEQALTDMKQWVSDGPVVDLYSGVGSIGLTIGGDGVKLIEINDDAVREMERNIELLGKKAEAILAPSEKALDHITGKGTIIVDPPRAGLHIDVIDRLLETEPGRIIYLSCNPVTQARDVALLAAKYGIRAHRGYNFFPRTPHIENLVILDLKA